MSELLIELVGPAGRVPTALSECRARLDQGWNFADKAAETAFHAATAPVKAADARKLPGTATPPRDETGS